MLKLFRRKNHEPEQTAEKPSLFSRLAAGLTRTGTQLKSGLSALFLGKKEIDADTLEELESQLLMADLGIEVTQKIIAQLTEELSRKVLKDPEALMASLKHLLKEILRPCEHPLIIDKTTSRPFVLLMVGVNGNGKTTTIGKLANIYQKEGHKVMLAAGDTFRAAAVEQLQVWGERNDVPVIAQQTGADSASVIYDALQAAKARQIDILIADTAGRLHTKQHLMEELAKIKRVLQKIDPAAPHEIMLVLDAGTGQNALQQAQTFHKLLGIHSLTLTKLDGTAKGGIVLRLQTHSISRSVTLEWERALKI